MKDKEFSARKIVWISLQNGEEIIFNSFGVTTLERSNQRALLITMLQRSNQRALLVTMLQCCNQRALLVTMLQRCNDKRRIVFHLRKNEFFTKVWVGERQRIFRQENCLDFTAKWKRNIFNSFGVTTLERSNQSALLVTMLQCCNQRALLVTMLQAL